MHSLPDAAHLQSQISIQLALAELATVDKIRAMHRDLEKLYRAQLVAVVLAEKLATQTPSSSAGPLRTPSPAMGQRVAQYG